MKSGDLSPDPFLPDFGAAKQVVREFHAAIERIAMFWSGSRTDRSKLTSTFEAATTSAYTWRGCHPFGEMAGAHTVTERFWAPLLSSLGHIQRREDVLMAGRNEMDGFGTTWVTSMGHLVGLFDAPWLGIPPTGKMAFLRYCEFNRVEDGRIAETALFFDVPHLMKQAGLMPFRSETATHLVQPGPRTRDGVSLASRPPESGARTLALINAMISDIGRWRGDLPLEEELRRTWAEDMIWWGPAGIGATYTIPRYAEQHAGPFRAAFSERSATTHICRLAEGEFGGFFGWPNFQATLSGDFMGEAATGKRGEFRVVDIYRRDGDKLAENWIFIDFLHFWLEQGVDVLARALGESRR